MDRPLLDPSWYRVAELRPRLRGHTRVHRHRYRGRRWYVLQDNASGRFHRFSPEAYEIIGAMDGERTMQQLWECACARLGDSAPTQPETVALLHQLHAADVLQCDVPPALGEMVRRHDRQRRAKRRQQLRTPLAIRIPLFDPSRLLDLVAPIGRVLVGPVGLIAWLALIAAAAIAAATHWDALTGNVVDRILTPQNLVLMWLTFPVVKLLHELGHAVIARRWGAEVHEIGVMLLVFSPVPYVDATSSSAFRSKWQRALVAAGGMLVELAVAAIALIAWAHMEAGVARAIAYNVVFIAGVSTLLFNGNPLLRFDAYYILADLLEIPNLAQRSTRYLGYLVERHAFGADVDEPPVDAPGERFWLIVYGVGSFAYRMLIYFVIITFVASRFFFVGVLLALWAGFSMIVAPLGKALKHLFASPRLERCRSRAVTLTATAIGALFAAVAALPVPLMTVAEGVVWVPERAVVRAAASGFVASAALADGALVRTGDEVARLEDPLLEAEARVLEHRVAALRARLRAQRASDRVQAAITEREVTAALRRLARVHDRLDDLVVRAAATGRLVLPRGGDLTGRYLGRGQQLAYVVEDRPVTVRTAVLQSEVDLVRQRTHAVEVRFPERLTVAVPATVRREIPAAGNALPSPVLGTGGGGRVAIDPRAAGGARSVEPLFLVDVTLPAELRHARVGSRVYVRFAHGAEPLAARWYRSLRRLFLREFDV